MSEAALSETEKLDIVFKKNYGKVSSTTSLPFYSEPAIDARPRIFQSQILRNNIPSTAPDVSDSNEFSFQNDPKQPGDYAASDTYGYITYYYRHQLVQLTGGNNQAFKGPSVGSIDNILQNSIPFNYDSAGGYGVSLEYSTDSGSTFQTIDFGTGEWVIDPDGGTLTFHEYADVSSIVNGTTLRPYLSFFAYTGPIGLDTGLFTEAAKTNETTKKFVHPNTTTHTLVVGTDQLDDENNALEVSGHSKFDSVSALDVTTTSDATLKQNIQVIQNALQKLESVRGVSFQWKATNQNSYGVIAQEVEKIFPDAIIQNVKGYKSVNYNSMIALLIESVKDVQHQQTILHSKLESIEAQLKKLTAPL